MLIQSPERLGEHRINIGSKDIPMTSHPIVALMVDHRLRRWPIIETAMGESIVYAGILSVVKPYTVSIWQTRYIEPIVGQFWPAVCNAGPTLSKHWLNVSCLRMIITRRRGVVAPFLYYTAKPKGDVCSNVK